jgi:hypothetical protein
VNNTNHITLKPYKLCFNGKKLAKVLGTKKLRIFHSFPTVYHLHHSDKRLKNQVKLPCILFGYLQIRYFKNYSKTVQNLNKLKTWKSCVSSISIQRHIICIIPTNRWENLLELQSTRFLIDPNSSIFKIVQNPWRIWKNLQR